ncbi:Protein CBG26052 [Caenorhabditis briggsae]|uniref:Protein CBG26052 n=1 Tax=Caenorhabditis briggsae TaxID=6238 RepID=B6IEE6_CAEBR|nr:Protein CBG26052 [Caenorhabditis briggsae]CAR98276.1 Protein CBG26052 [Caenorhabditis briggsae]
MFSPKMDNPPNFMHLSSH